MNAARLLAGILSIAALLGPVYAMAAPASFDDLFFASPDAAIDVPNVVDRRGCVRLCDQDLAPCDPMLYKRADGRCTRDY